jgi:ADP-ribosylglycohydrolase
MIEMENPKLKDQILGGILGLAVADAVGVPVEFKSRESLRNNPFTGMQGYGTYNQPPGTWSDDTSLTLCLLDSLANKKIDYADIMQKFISWIDEAKYTPHGAVFDVGIATRKALQRFQNGTEPLECGGTSEQDNGNGSLMRILPIAFYLHAFYGLDFTKDEKAVAIIHNVSSLTHAHKRSLIACGIYLIIAGNLLEQSANLKKTIHSSLKKAKEYYEDKKEYAGELKHYKRLFKKDCATLPETEIKSSGYVVDTLEAALWSLLNTDNYKDCVLKAVNLGEDTDTVAAVTGGLAGMFYGVDSIPKDWLKQLARRDYIEKLCEEFYCSLCRSAPK